MNRTVLIFLAGALLAGGEFLQPMLDKGVLGALVSAGTLPLLYLAVGLKVGAELAGLGTAIGLFQNAQLVLGRKPAPAPLVQYLRIGPGGGFGRF